MDVVDLTLSEVSAIDLCSSSSQPAQPADEGTRSSSEQLHVEEVTSPAPPPFRLNVHVGQIGRTTGSELLSQAVPGRRCSSCAGVEGAECHSLSARRLDGGQDDSQANIVQPQRLEYVQGSALIRPCHTDQSEGAPHGNDDDHPRKKARVQQGSSFDVHDAAQAASIAIPEVVHSH